MKIIQQSDGGLFLFITRVGCSTMAVGVCRDPANPDSVVGAVNLGCEQLQDFFAAGLDLANGLASERAGRLR